MRKDFKQDTWELFNKSMNSNGMKRRLFLFGAGKQGREAYKDIRRYDSSWELISFLDNDVKRYNENIEGIPINSPQYLEQFDAEGYVVLICNDLCGNIAKQLDSLGVKYYFSKFWMNNPMKDFYEQKDISKSKVKKLLSLVADRESKDIISEIIKKREIGFMDYTDLTYKGNEYFSFFHPLEQEVFIDGGAYDGDTIDDFSIFTHNKFKRVYSFEPDKKNVQKLLLKPYDRKRIKIFEAALYNKNTEICLQCFDTTYCSCVNTGEGGYTVNCIALDELIHERVTFIKLDIEGSELKALEGAKHIIMRDKPRLAICIYHKLDDLWEIPEFIHALVPEYKLFIRHHGVRCYGTVLYATLEQLSFFD